MNYIVKRNVLNCLLKEAREVAVLTLVGRLFHARAAVTRKDRSPGVFSIDFTGCWHSNAYISLKPERNSIGLLH